jgi:hypothetical protein
MKILLFITGHKQLDEYHYFRIFLERLNLNRLCDIFIYCNNPEISSEIVDHYKNFNNKNKNLFVTSLNSGYRLGGIEALSKCLQMGVFHGYDYVIHLHPDVFLTSDKFLLETLNQNLNNDSVFLVTRYFPEDYRHFSTDFFIFKPKLLTINIFIAELSSYTDFAEHYLYDMIKKYNVKYKIIKRFDNDCWNPRRIDDHLKLYHEHDLEKVKASLSN